jgi:hypothetical protein
MEDGCWSSGAKLGRGKLAALAWNIMHFVKGVNELRPAAVRIPQYDIVYDGICTSKYLTNIEATGSPSPLDQGRFCSLE